MTKDIKLGEVTALEFQPTFYSYIELLFECMYILTQTRTTQAQLCHFLCCTEPFVLIAITGCELHVKKNLVPF